jgi:hypothetical protein
MAELRVQSSQARLPPCSAVILYCELLIVFRGRTYDKIIGKRFSEHQYHRIIPFFSRSHSQFRENSNKPRSSCLYMKSKYYKKGKTDDAKTGNWKVNFQTYIHANMKILLTLCH